MMMVRVLCGLVIFGGLAGLVALLAGRFSGQQKRTWMIAGCLVTLVGLSLVLLVTDLEKDPQSGRTEDELVTVYLPTTEFTVWNKAGDDVQAEVMTYGQDGYPMYCDTYDGIYSETEDRFLRDEKIGRNYCYAYDARGRLIQVDNSHLGKTYFCEYDEQGRLLAVYRYDATGSAAGQGGLEECLRYTYNTDGWEESETVQSFADGDCTHEISTVYAYNQQEKTREIYTYGNSNGDEGLRAYGVDIYDQQNRIVQSTFYQVQDGVRTDVVLRHTTYGYDHEGRLVQEQLCSGQKPFGWNRLGTECLDVEVLYTYDEQGNLTEKTVCSVQGKARELLYKLAWVFTPVTVTDEVAERLQTKAPVVPTGSFGDIFNESLGNW